MNLWIILKKELRSYFSSWIAYVLFSVFLAMSGYFFYTDLVYFTMWQGSDIQIGMWQFFFHDIRFIMLLMIPVLTMGLFAEEKKSGTVELLFTFPLKDIDILMGKFLSSIFIFFLMLFFTIIYPVVLNYIHAIDFAPVAAGYLGLFLMGCAFISVGILVSSITENQIIAAFVTFVCLLFFWTVGWNEGVGGEIVTKLTMAISFFDHFYGFARGVIEIKDVVFNISFTLLFLFFTIKSLESRKWKGVK